MPHTITLAGLDGANPLCMLASLGAFRIASLHDPDATMHWVNQNGWRPVLTTIRTPGEFVQDALLELHRLAGPTARDRQVEQLRTQAAKLGKEKARKGKTAPDEVRRGRIDSELALIDVLIRELSIPSTTSGIPFLNEHDLVAVSREVYRRHGSDALQHPVPPMATMDADVFAALACDGIVKAKKDVLAVEPTPFSFSNGGSGKCLLKDFRNCAAHASSISLGEILAGRMPRKDDVTSLLWDPLDQQSYALRWSDPGNPANPATCNATANALAFLGLCTLVVVPHGGRIAAVGMDRRLRRWTWPIWGCDVDYRAAQALCASPRLQAEPIDRRMLHAMGIVEVYTCRRFFRNKRPFFSPSKAL